MAKAELIDGILAHLPAELIRACYSAAPGNEIASGKFMSPESSAALSANAFGYFLDKPAQLPPLPLDLNVGWPPHRVSLETECRFPWNGGRHPWLDVMVETETALVGIESKRYEPFRTRKAAAMSDAYWRPVWGDQMAGYCSLRDDLRSGSIKFQRLDAAQLIKHAFGLRSCIHRETVPAQRRAVLVYLYAEPRALPDGRKIPCEQIEQHRQEVAVFSSRVADDEVTFRAFTYRDLLDRWRHVDDAQLKAHAEAIEEVFAP